MHLNFYHQIFGIAFHVSPGTISNVSLVNCISILSNL